MIRSLVSLCLILSTAASALPQETRTVFAMKTGILLRMHVVAQDDTQEMQRVKLRVRDAVQEAYASDASSGTMLRKAAAMLPTLRQAACEAAAAEGFTGAVTVTIEQASFDQRTLDGLTIPAGEYPALMIRLGQAQGRNWWGLIDPELAVRCAALPGTDDWDWSFLGFLRALFATHREVICHE